MTLRLDPATTAVITQELQGAAVGPNAGLAALAEEARREAPPNTSRLLPIARAPGTQVVHGLGHAPPCGLPPRSPRCKEVRSPGPHESAR